MIRYRIVICLMVIILFALYVRDRESTMRSRFARSTIQASLGLQPTSANLLVSIEDPMNPLIMDANPRAEALFTKEEMWIDSADLVSTILSRFLTKGNN
jgi:hypothetical protein